MYQLNFSEPCHVHFIGIGGISMSALAEMLCSRGFAVSGSDAHESALTDSLVKKGINICYGQRAENITSDIDLVVYTAAIHQDNPELIQAQALGLPMLTRSQLLGQIMDNYPDSVGVAGTHGKTTTTSMLGEIFLAAQMDPTITVGGILPSIGSNLRIGKAPLFLAEACEYSNSFLDFRPKYTVILNVEEDHLDFFKDIGDIRRSFRKFAGNTKPDGATIINGAIENYRELTDGLPQEVITYGMDSSFDFYPKDISHDGFSRYSFTAMHGGERIADVRLNIPGIHNVSNAIAAIALASAMKINPDLILRGLSHFTGTERRFEHKGDMGGVVIIDDYAHHPTEIRATLSAASDCPHERIVVAFQPHTYSRTVQFLDGFADALSAADVVVLTDIYAAREVNTYGISSNDIVQLLRERGTEAYYCPTFEEAEKFLKKICVNGDLLITMGAGNVVEIGEDLLRG
ncbi:MAG: UDP-N-acetylmuramate--L-alanine ligase [Clostridiales bacterium]|nr:UDP-N-acetylmuramate--L-alanine ligase [Clostridiales bacterium]